MVDIVTPPTRSRMMSGIGGKNTSPELIIRKALFRRGFRFRLHRKDLPGSPDLVLPRYQAIIFVHGCYWHRHGCRLTTTPGTNAEFWEGKFATNVERDTQQHQRLRELGWRVATVWECATRSLQGDLIADRLATWLTSSREELQIPVAGELDR